MNLELQDIRSISELKIGRGERLSLRLEDAGNCFFALLGTDLSRSQRRKCAESYKQAFGEYLKREMNDPGIPGLVRGRMRGWWAESAPKRWDNPGNIKRVYEEWQSIRELTLVIEQVS